jgi:hypothetical protein
MLHILGVGRGLQPLLFQPHLGREAGKVGLRGHGQIDDLIRIGLIVARQVDGGLVVLHWRASIIMLNDGHGLGLGSVHTGRIPPTASEDVLFCNEQRRRYWRKAGSSSFSCFVLC